MPDQQPEVANLSPDSFTAQKLVCLQSLYSMLCVNCSSNMQRRNTCTSRRGATSSALYRYALCSTYSSSTHPATDSMVEQEPTRMVQAPPPNQLLDARRDLLLRPPRGAPTTSQWSRRPQLLGPLPAQLPTTRRTRRRGGRRAGAWG
jgi:hypothetical protein